MIASAPLQLSARIPELDGIRGIAILTVLVYHWIIVEGDKPFSIVPDRLTAYGHMGWSGVDLFFVLSGFLIGGILIDTRRASNYFSVFYVRRFYRIIPPYILLCLVAVAVYHFNLSGSAETKSWLYSEKLPWWAYLTFAQNWFMVAYADANSRMIDVTWSLAVEEQFYLALPFVVRYARARRLPLIFACGILLAPLFRLLCYLTLDEVRASYAGYVLMPCRMDALLMGALLAWAMREPEWRDWLREHTLLLNVAFVIFGAGVAYLAFGRVGVGSLSMMTWGYTCVALFYSTLLIIGLTQPTHLLSRAFRNRALARAGVIAYALYLFHQPVLGLMHAALRGATPALLSWRAFGVTVVSGVVLFLLTRASWEYFEKPLVERGRCQTMAGKQDR
jgi:peptidoglycan/LPS O-acetylase OafA/YrhL